MAKILLKVASTTEEYSYSYKEFPYLPKYRHLPEDIQVMARSIITTQNQQIDTMNAYLEEQGKSPYPYYDAEYICEKPEE